MHYDRILITRMKFIGDVVLTTPVIRSVREACPAAWIAYMGEKQAVSLLGQDPSLNEIIGFDFGRPTIIEQPRVACALRRRKFDLAIDLFGNPRSALLTYLSGARVRVGPDRPGRGRFYTIRVRDDGKPKTAVAFHNQYLEAAGIPVVAHRPTLSITADEEREARIYLRWVGSTDRPVETPPLLVGIHPGATWPAKRWLPERFAELADRMTATLGARVVLTAGPQDDATTNAVLEHSFANITVLRGLPLRQLAAILRQCAVYVTNDNGTMHIAAAVGTPTIGIFGPGEEEIWFPYPSSEGHKALRRDVFCHPCHLDVCNRPGDAYMECMKLLTVDDVFDQVRRILAERPTPTHPS